MKISKQTTSKKLLHSSKNIHKFAQCLLALGVSIPHRCWLFNVFICLAFVHINAAQANVSWDNERAIYKQARNALNKHQINQFVAHKAALVDYPLYPYLVYDELTFRMSKLDDEDIDKFLVNYSDGPLAKRLRLKWLFQLQKKNRWKSFLKYYQDDDSTELYCYFLQTKLKQGLIDSETEILVKQIRDVWLVGVSQPRQCDPIFKWFADQGYLTAELIWERFALAMQAGQISLARYLSKKLPASHQAKAKLWLAVHANPKANLKSAKLKQDNHTNRQIIRHGLQRLARKDLTAAHKHWLAIQKDYAFGSDLHDEVERNLALRAAYRHDARATAWMYALPNDVMDPATSMWRVRSAIRSLEWDLVLRGIALLSEEEKSKARWQYWRARALFEMGMQSDAKDIYKNIANERSYYGFLAADKLSLSYNMADLPVQHSVEDLQRIEQIPAVIRTRELLLHNQLSDARREWNFVTDTFTPRQLQVAAVLAHDWQWHDYAIRTIAKGNFFDDLAIRFPTPFDNLVNRHAKQKKLAPSLVYGIIRRESAFNPQARSPVGARGLMQLMPATAKQVSRQLKLPAPSSYDLYQAGFNIKLGTTYISDMLKRFSGHRALASAAYNAGPHRVNAWLPEYQDLPADVWIDTIPFTETREYVQAIFAYTAVFEWKIKQSSTRLSQYMLAVSSKP